MFSTFSLRTAINSITELATFSSFKLILASLIFVIGLFFSRVLARKAYRISEKLTSKHKVQAKVESFSYSLFLILTLAVAIETTGIPLTNLIIVLSVIFVGVMISGQSLLKNLVFGVYLYLDPPFKTGDLVKIGDMIGTVEKIGLLETIIITFEKESVHYSNHLIFADRVINYSTYPEQCLKIGLRISYEDDLDKVFKIIHNEIESLEIIHSEPKAEVFVSELEESWILLQLICWCSLEDLVSAKSLLYQGIKKQFDSNEISFPFPQKDLYIHGK